MDGDGESVTDVETAGDIRRRKGNDKLAFRFRRAIRGRLGFKKPLCFPPVVPSGFYGLWVVPCRHRLGHVCSASDTEESDDE